PRSRARGWWPRRPGRSCPTTSASPNPTSATATSMQSFRGRSCGTTSRDFCASSETVPSEAELRLRERLSRLRSLRLPGGVRVSREVERLEEQLERLSEQPPSDDQIWRQVELARHEDRPYTLDYLERLFEDFIELHGDRARADDPAVVVGVARFGGRTVALIGNPKGRNLKERVHRNWGMAFPEGYRKAMRVMELADRHGFPLISLVDITGANPGVAAEQ